MRAKKESRRSGPGAGEDLRERAAEEGLDLILRLPDGGGGCDDLGADGIASGPARAEGLDGRFVESGHRSEGTGDQVQLVLDHQVRRKQRRRQAGPPLRVRGAVEAARVIAVGPAQEAAGGTHPGKRRELVHRGDQEGGQPPVDRLVHGEDRQRAVAAELALEVHAHDAQLARLVMVGQQRERLRSEGLPAPGAVLQRDGRRPAPGVRPVLPDLGAGRVRAVVALPPEVVGRGRLAYPQPDLEGPFSVAARSPGTFQLQGADQPRGASKLIQGQEAQGVAHDHAHPRAAVAVRVRVAQPSQHHGKGGKAEIGLGLAAAGGEEQEIHRLAGRVARIDQPGEIQQDEGELKGPPAGLVDIQTLAEGPGHRAVGHPEGIESVLVFGQDRDPSIDPPSGQVRPAQQFPRRLPARALQILHSLQPRLNPGAVLLDERPKGGLGRGPVGQGAESLHRQLDPRDFRGDRLPPPRRGGSTPSAAAGSRRRGSPSRPTRRGRWAYEGVSA